MKKNSEKKPRMRDVAELASVSTSTVSHVINGTRVVAEETRIKVEEAIRILNYNINPIARSLRSGKSGLVGFVVANLSNYFYTSIAKGIESVLVQAGYHLVLIDSTENKKTEIDNVKSLCSQGVDGLIIAPTTNDFAYLERIVEKEFPIVFVDRIPANYNSDCIMLSNTEGACAATKHLIDKGHKDIGFIGFTYDGLDGTMNERLEGYKKAHIEAGFRINDGYIKVEEGGTALLSEMRHAKSYMMMEHLLTTRISAVVCGNNLAAIGVFSYLKEHAIPIPGRIAFVTFDDEFWLTMATPNVSAVAQPAETYGVLAAQRVLDRINGKRLPHECFRLKPQLIIRQSC